MREWIVVENGAISKHECGPEIPSGAIEVRGFSGYVGQPTAHLTEDFQPRQINDLIKSGLVDAPPGMIIDGGQIRQMTPFEMASSGFIGIDTYKATIKSQIEIALTQRLYSGFMFEGHSYPADLQAQTAAIDAGQDFQESGDTSFLGAFCKANIWIPMDEDTFTRFRSTGRHFVRSLFNSVWELKHTKIAEAKTPEEVKAFFEAWSNP